MNIDAEEKSKLTQKILFLYDKLDLGSDETEACALAWVGISCNRENAYLEPKLGMSLLDALFFQGIKSLVTRFSPRYSPLFEARLKLAADKEYRAEMCTKYKTQILPHLAQAMN